MIPNPTLCNPKPKSNIPTPQPQKRTHHAHPIRIQLDQNRINPHRQSPEHKDRNPNKPDSPPNTPLDKNTLTGANNLSASISPATPRICNAKNHNAPLSSIRTPNPTSIPVCTNPETRNAKITRKHHWNRTGRRRIEPETKFAFEQRSWRRVWCHVFL